MKRVATGQKNWLFKGSLAAGERAANLLTIIGSAIRNDLDVRAYLDNVLRRVLAGETDWSLLTPHAWKSAHPEAVREYRSDERRQAADRKKIRRARRRIKKSTPRRKLALVYGYIKTTLGRSGSLASADLAGAVNKNTKAKQLTEYRRNTRSWIGIMWKDAMMVRRGSGMPIPTILTVHPHPVRRCEQID